jgi:SH3-like domain-containing protein
MLAHVVAVLVMADALYVQASAVNLREQPNPKALIGGKARIGQQCEKLADAADGWVEVRCDASRGFTKAELLGAAPIRTRGPPR